MSTSAKAYHHGDLRSALVAGAIELLENGETYSLRAVARHVGVSATAPYRHFPDRAALDAAVAVEGFADLRGRLADTLARPRLADADTPTLLGELGVAYVDFALRRPTVFRLMFGHECDEEDSARVEAAQSLRAVVTDLLAQRRLGPGDEAADESLATGLWGLAHGLACLHLDGKFRPEPAAEVADRVREAVRAVLGTAG